MVMHIFYLNVYEFGEGTLDNLSKYSAISASIESKNYKLD